jgi:3-hydroxybutyrate dehydrogenase
MSRVALVTGSSGGIGAAIAKRLESDGLDVLGVDLKAARDRDLSADLATPEGNRAAVDAALERFGRLDVIVAAAGFQHIASVAEFPEDRWDALLSVMLTSPFLLS